MWTKEITKVVKEGGKNIRVRETDMTKEVEDRKRERFKDATLLEPAAKECRKLLEEMDPSLGPPEGMQSADILILGLLTSKTVR